MVFPNTDFPAALDAAQSRTDLVSICYDDDFNYHDEQIRKIQEYFGTSAELIGQRIAGNGPGGMVSPIASGASARALKLAARNAFAAGYVLSVGDNYDVSYTEKLFLDYLGVLWTLGGIDASAMLKIPMGALPAPGVAGRIHWDTATPGLYFDDGAVQIPVGLGVGAYLDWASDYSYTQALVPVEEVVGGGTFDGGLVNAQTVYFRAAITNVFAAAGMTRVRLYDMGPAAGPPDAIPRLVSELQFIVQGGPRSLNQVLTIVSVGPGVNEILDSDRMYEVAIIQTGTAGDLAYLGSAGLEVI